jgi:hypothetical protein
VINDGDGLGAWVACAGLSPSPDLYRIYSGSEEHLLRRALDHLALQKNPCLVGWNLKRVGGSVAARAIAHQIPCEIYRLPCIDLQRVVARMLPDDNGTGRPCLHRTCSALGITYAQDRDTLCIRNWSPDRRQDFEALVRYRLGIFRELFSRMEGLCSYDLSMRSGWGPDAIVEFADPFQSTLDL